MRYREIIAQLQDTVAQLENEDSFESVANDLDNLADQLRSIGNTDLDSVEDECRDIAEQLESAANDLRIH
jgi:archaellum component FlaC